MDSMWMKHAVNLKINVREMTKITCPNGWLNARSLAFDTLDLPRSYLE